MLLKRTGCFIEFDLIFLGEKVGTAEINTDTKELCCLKILEPYQGRGYGQLALEALLKEYDITNLDVAIDNAEARHIYEKFGFKDGEPIIMKMRR